MLTACGGLHDDKTGNVTIILPEAKAAGRSIAKEKIDGLEQATALYRVHMNDRVLEGTGGKFSAYFAVGLKVDIYIECLNSNRDVIVRTGIKTVVVKNRGNVVDFNLMADGNEIAQPTSQPATPPIPPAPQPVPGKVTYNGNGADSGTPSDTQSYDAGSEVTLQTGEPSRTGYTFAGWTSDKDLKYTNPTNSQEETIAQGTVFVSDSSSVQGVTDKIANFKMPDGGVVLTATWIPNTYIITYYDVDASSASTAFSGTHGSNHPTQHTYGTATPLVNPTKTNYKFLGWFATSAGTDSPVTELASAGYTGNITLYAKWEQVYTLTLNLNGGSWANASDNKTQYSASDLPLTLPTPTKTSSGVLPISFEGWYTEPTFVNKVTEIAQGETGAKEFYAKWIEFTMVSVTGGTPFTMGDGSSSNNAAWSGVTVSNFKMGKYEITQAQWQAVMGNLPSSMATADGDAGNNPVNYVNWYQALVFCNKLSVLESKQPCYTINGSTNPDNWGTVPTSANDNTWDAVVCDWDVNGYRLPTEAEWEYAARGGSNKSHSKYSGVNDATTPSPTEDDLKTVAWYTGNAGSKSHEVGTTPVKENSLGISDMSGNVYEWCWDWYSSSGYASANGSTTSGPCHKFCVNDRV